MFQLSGCDLVGDSVIWENIDHFVRNISCHLSKHYLRDTFSIMQKLTDKEIRRALIVHLGRRAKPPHATLEEVQVCNGNAIADVVAVYKTMHCYEIKGETDSINRIVRQSQFYDQAFPLITLVTTSNHLKRAEVIVPKHWGIVVANSNSNETVTFKHIRGATRNPSYLPEIALLSLWRSELVKFPNISSPSLEKMNRQRIAELIVSRVPTSAINEVVGKALTARSSNGAIFGNPVTYIQHEHISLASGLLKG